MTAASRARLELSRDEILARRRAVAALDRRLPPRPESLRRAAWAGLSDSMPRAALLSIHARVERTGPDALDDPSLVQVWGPRFSAYVVAERDRAVFTLGRLPEDRRRSEEFQAVADRLEGFLAGREIPYSEAGRALGVNPNMLRYAAPTGRVLIRWDGARQPTIRMVPAPGMDAVEARLELARRYFRVFGPGTADGFSDWAGIRLPRARSTVEALAGSLSPVRTPVGDGWILADDEAAFREAPATPAPARLLPSGDTWFLLQGRERELLVPDAARRSELWTSRVWPGAVIVDGEVVGVWRRASADVDVESWRTLSAPERAAVEEEAASSRLPGLEGGLRVRWGSPG